MLAETIEPSADERDVTFTLRSGARFHNGAPLTSREVVWAWERYLDPKTAWPCRGNFDGSRQIKVTSVEATDERHVVFRLASPAPAFLDMMARSDCDAAGIAHPDSVDAEGRWTGAIGTGPFRFGEWRRGQFVQLEAFRDYAARSDATDGLAGAKAAHVDHLRFILIPDPARGRVALAAGNLDVLSDTDPTTAKDLAATPGVTVKTSPTAGINALVSGAMTRFSPIHASVRGLWRRSIATDCVRAFTTARVRRPIRSCQGAHAGGRLLGPARDHHHQQSVRPHERHGHPG